MSFAKRLVSLRKVNQMTQQQMASAAQVHVSQIRRYEAGESQPTLEVLRNIAMALHISADMLVFNDDERGPHSDELKLFFEAVDQFSEQEQEIAKVLIESLIIRQTASRYTKTRLPLMQEQAS